MWIVPTAALHGAALKAFPSREWKEPIAIGRFTGSFENRSPEILGWATRGSFFLDSPLRCGRTIHRGRN
jgi:hypothetical protein